ncbi:MAG: hypothetical protein EPO06_10555 [Burkholderiaceae bacterium]|nr:MAG: hypothetical protein EPO06_10555 [Burkholderiaceae bacterium]
MKAEEGVSTVKCAGLLSLILFNNGRCLLAMPTLYLKTVKAHELLNGPREALSSAHRRLLIFVDGKKDAAALIRHFGAFGMTQVALDELTTIGLLERQTLPDSRRSKNRAENSESERHARIQKQIVSTLTDQLGPIADEIAQWVEECGNTQELQTQAKKVIQILEAYEKQEVAVQVEQLLTKL